MSKYSPAAYQRNKKKRDEWNRKWRLKNKAKVYAASKRANHKWYYRLKDKIFAKYGNKCGRCGVEDKRILCIDHVHGGGRREQEILRQNRTKFLKAVLEDRGGRYQILCHNCNWIKRFEKEESAIFHDAVIKKKAA
jgi:hypothetical protein